MDVIHDDTDTLELLDNAAMSFMVLTVSRLNTALLENGVTSSDSRKSICAAFLFQFAYQHDAGWLLEGGLKLFPLVAFAERDDARRQSLGGITKLHVPTLASSWHEYAHGIVSQFFEDDSESTGDLPFGSHNVES